MITDEQKQTVFDILVLPKNRNYYEIDPQLQNQIRNEIQQITNMPYKQLYNYLYYNKINFIKAIQDYIHNNKDNLFQPAKNRIAPRKKRVYNFYTDEQKQIIANIVLETDYINCNPSLKRQARERIAQKTGLTEKQIFDYIYNNKDKLFQQAENRMENINSTDLNIQLTNLLKNLGPIMQLTNELEQIFNNSKQNEAQTFIKK